MRSTGLCELIVATTRISMGRFRIGAAVMAGAALLVGPTCASAQTVQGVTTIGGLIDGLFAPAIPFNPGNETLISQTDYERRAADSREGIAIGIGNALASFPLGASSAGFTYQVNSATGERTLKSLTFGPVFVDRAITNGKGVLNMGVAYQGAAFDTLQGLDLKNDGFPTQSQLGTFVVDGSGVGDAWRTTLDINSHVGLFSGSYGITERLDIGWAVPFVSLSVRGRFLRDYNGGRDWDANLLANGVPIRTIYPGKTGTETVIDKQIDAQGLGDIQLRAKYAFGPSDGQRMHVSADLRLPTGDEENLLGAGKAAFRVTTGGTFPLGGSAAFNVNGGYTSGGLTSEVNFSAGTEVAMLPSKQLTMTFEVMGQNLRDTVTAVNSLVSFDRVLANPADGFLARRVVVQYGFWERGSTTLLRGAVGAKYAIGGNWLLTGSALFRLNDNGYQAKIVPFIGLEHTWSTR